MSPAYEIRIGDRDDWTSSGELSIDEAAARALFNTECLVISRGMTIQLIEVETGRIVEERKTP